MKIVWTILCIGLAAVTIYMLRNPEPGSVLGQATQPPYATMYAQAYQQFFACLREDKPFRADVWKERMERIDAQAAKPLAPSVPVAAE